MQKFIFFLHLFTKNYLKIAREIVTVSISYNKLRLNVLETCFFKCASCNPTTIATCTRLVLYKIILSIIEIVAEKPDQKWLMVEIVNVSVLLLWNLVKPQIFAYLV